MNAFGCACTEKAFVQLSNKLDLSRKTLTWHLDRDDLPRITQLMSPMTALRRSCIKHSALNVPKVKCTMLIVVALNKLAFVVLLISSFALDFLAWNNAAFLIPKEHGLDAPAALLIRAECRFYACATPLNRWKHGFTAPVRADLTRPVAFLLVRSTDLTHPRPPVERSVDLSRHQILFGARDWHAHENS